MIDMSGYETTTINNMIGKMKNAMARTFFRQIRFNRCKSSCTFEKTGKATERNILLISEEAIS